jgi:RNA polymerase sigma-70 factor (ECF subfamily)
MTDSFADDLIALLPNLRRYAMSLCRRSDLADDLVQITVERALGAKDRRDPAARLEVWLFRILRNAWIDMIRRNKSRGTEVDIDDAHDLSVTDGRNTVETHLMLSSAEAAIAALPTDQRDVMMLICVEELSYAEAAEVLGVPIGTVMSRLARARNAVAISLGIK